MSSGTLFTCNSCVIQFKTSDQQRYHMKTEWHRYNLKRRVAQLSPITAEEFAEKLQISEMEMGSRKFDEFGFEILKPLDDSDSKPHHHSKGHHGHHHTKSDVSEAESIVSDRISEVPTKQKTRSDSISSKISHLTIDSQDTNTDYGESSVSEYNFTSDSNYGSTEEEIDSQTEATSDSDSDLEDIALTECIYCGASNKDIERNVKHMFSKHGLYIPERSYLVDLPGLLTFIMDTVAIDHLCFCCNFEGSSLESIRAHMNSKRHCRLPYETGKERALFAEFYDFTSLEEDKEQRAAVSSIAKPKKSIKFQVEEYSDNLLDPEQISEASNLERQSRVTSSRREARNLVSAADKRLVSGVTEKQFIEGLKKMQQIEKRAVDAQLRRNVKRMNFQTHYRDELLQ